MKEPRAITADRWRKLAWLKFDGYPIPAAERSRWVLAPEDMNFAVAHVWARQIRADRIIALSSGETMVRLREVPIALDLDPPMIDP